MFCISTINKGMAGTTLQVTPQPISQHLHNTDTLRLTHSSQGMTPAKAQAKNNLPFVGSKARSAHITGTATHCLPKPPKLSEPGGAAVSLAVRKIKQTTTTTHSP